MLIQKIPQINLYHGYSNLNRCNSPSNIVPKFNNLTCDTVSFGIGNKILIQDEETGVPRMTVAAAKRAHDDALDAAQELSFVLKKYLKNLVASPSCPDAPICEGGQGIKIRVKDNVSIAEKAVSRKIKKKQSVNVMGDLIGARIVLRDTSREQVDKVLRELTKAVKKGDLNIIEIENYRPFPAASYCSTRALDALEMACGKNLELRRELPIESGYTAIHLGIKLKTGHKAELQIMGRDTETVKEIEDFIYKLKCKKNFSKKYKHIYDVIKPLYNSLSDSNREIYMKYIYDNYAYARGLEPQTITYKKHKLKFIPLPYFLPKELSFEWLQEEKEKCDRAKEKADKLRQEKFSNYDRKANEKSNKIGTAKKP